MSKIKGYTMEEVAEHRKDKLVSDYNFCKAKLAEIRRHEQEIESIRSAYNKMIVKYRMEKKKDMRFRLFGTAPSRNLTLIHMVGMRIRGCGLSSLSGVKNRKECEV